MEAPAWLDRVAYPFAIRRVDVGDGSLAVTEVGSGPTVVFAHGTPTWSFEWRHLLRALSTTHRCVAVDHLGFGLSERPPGADYAPEAHARRFRLALERLGVERYTLVAHDFGGPIALDGALDQPEQLERVVLLNTFAFPFDAPRDRRLAWLAGTRLWRLLYRHMNLSFAIARSAWGQGPRPPEVWAQYAARFADASAREQVLFALARSLGGSSVFFQSLWDRRARLCNVPLHIVWGAADSAFKANTLARLREAWPHATVRTLPDAGHWPHEEEPERCIDEVRRFLVA